MATVVTGWGKCLPPAVLTNDDLADFMDTSDAWIRPRTGIAERRVSHVGMTELAYVAAARAMAAAGLEPADCDAVIVATASPDLLIPNTASRVQHKLGNTAAAAFDINVGCCGFIYGLTVANGLISTGVHERILVIGAERLTPILDWTIRDSAILFGDGAGAVVLERADQSNGQTGLLGAYLACNPVPGEALMATDLGTPPSPPGPRKPFNLQFDGREVFRHAVPGMVNASLRALERAGLSVDDVDLLVPHQANLRIVEAVGKKLPFDAAKVVTNLQRYGNTSAASIPIALCEAIEEGRVDPGATLLIAAFGAGLTSAAAVIGWGQRVTPKAAAEAELPACNETARQLIDPALDFQRAWHAERESG
jgi:3-oxoacyl-[acyl-carrier-protein] synthase-3